MLEEQVFEAYGLKLFERATTHQEGWVVSTSQIAFFRPAVPFEEIILESQTIKFIDEVDFEERRLALK